MSAAKATARSALAERSVATRTRATAGAAPGARGRGLPDAGARSAWTLSDAPPSPDPGLTVERARRARARCGRLLAVPDTSGRAPVGRGGRRLVGMSVARAL